MPGWNCDSCGHPRRFHESDRGREPCGRQTCCQQYLDPRRYSHEQWTGHPLRFCLCDDYLDSDPQR